MLTFLVPSGIGDFSAMYCKLCNLKRDFQVLATRDCPLRIYPYLNLLPKIQKSGYGNFPTDMVLVNTLLPGMDLETLPDGEHFLSVNGWLEEGKKIDDWLPIPTSYHYHMSIPESLVQVARDSIEEVKYRPLIGIYTTAYGNARHWGFWDSNGWFELIQLVKTMVPPESVFVFIGADYDIGISDQVYSRCISDSTNSLYTVGQFHIGSTIELIRRLDYFFCFPSGLGFLADVVNTPSMMWFPKHLEKMCYTFPDPKNVESGVTTHRLFETPEQAAQGFKERGLRHLEERVHAKNSYQRVWATR